MLQFWKKSGSKEKQDRRNSLRSSPSKSGSSTCSDVPATNGNISPIGDSNDPGSVGPLRGFREEELIFGDLGASETDDAYQRHKFSRLSKTLIQVLTDKGALAYFIQYMEARRRVHYIKFWLDSESFRAAAKCLGSTPTEDTSGKPVPWAISREVLESNTLSFGVDSASIASTEDGSMSPLVETYPTKDETPELRLGKETEIPVFELPSPTTSKEEFELSRADNLCRDALMDAVRIFQKYLSPIGGKKAMVQVSESALNKAVELICREDGHVDPECFVEAQQNVYDLMEKEFFNDFLRSDFHCKHQIDVLTSGNVALSDILFNETALFHFAEFMEQENNQSLLEFWLAANNFHQQLLEKSGCYDPMEAQNDAIILYDKYFSLQATCPLGFSDIVRLEVEQNICREEGPLPDCFHKPAKIVMHILEKNFFHPFLSSQLYMRYLSELINTIQSSPALLGRSRKSGSDCSSEHSISSHSIPLSTEESQPSRKVIHNVDDREMSIDSRQLYDPDSLWRRRHQSGLSFGRINELGRFETDFEPEPDRKGESRLTRVVKKFVNLEEDKAKEEMAWQIAAMIVKDVTSVTLGNSPSTTDKQPLGS